jgi:hybrid cluster-associated redox disulfide protein
LIFDIFGIMTSSALASDQTVAQVLQQLPDAPQAFISLGMDCVGCHLMRFCTLEYAAQSYHIDLERLLMELKKVAEGATKNT